MNERYDVPETSVNIRRITKNGDDVDYQDVVAGLEVRNGGVLQIDLRNVRPIRANNLDNIVVELSIHDVLEVIGIRLGRKRNDE